MKSSIKNSEKNREELQKEFTKQYDTSDPVSFSKMQHGYIYLKYIDQYIYKMRKSLSRLHPNGDQDIIPSPTHYSEDVESLIDMGVRFTNKGASSLETNSYHAKVMMYEDAKKVFYLQDELNLPNMPKSVIPYTIARKAVIDCPERILLIDCACRKTRGEKGCKPIDCCMILGEPWVSWGLEYMKEANPKVITQEEALEVIKLHREAGHVQNAFFKDACGNDGFYGFCNCCSCCCVALVANNYANAPVYAESGYIREVDLDKCEGCGTCEQHCIFMACNVVNGKINVDHKKCKGCGMCKDKCSNHANTMKLDNPEISAPFDMEVLAPNNLRKV